MLAVQWKLFCVDDFEDYYHCVTASDEFFAYSFSSTTLLRPMDGNTRRIMLLEDDYEAGP